MIVDDECSVSVDFDESVPEFGDESRCGWDEQESDDEYSYHTSVVFGCFKGAVPMVSEGFRYT